MTQDWKLAGPGEDTGVVVHGPMSVARAPVITFELGCLEAPQGLALHLRWQATDFPADTIRCLDDARRAVPLGQEPTGSAATAQPSMHTEVAGLAGAVAPSRARSTADGYVLTSQYWLNNVPSGTDMRLSIAWPVTGPSALTTDLHLHATPLP